MVSAVVFVAAVAHMGKDLQSHERWHMKSLVWFLVETEISFLVDCFFFLATWHDFKVCLCCTVLFSLFFLYIMPFERPLF